MPYWVSIFIPKSVYTNKCPYSKNHPCFVSVKALLIYEYMTVHWDQPWSIFLLVLTQSLNKKVVFISVSQSLCCHKSTVPLKQRSHFKILGQLLGQSSLQGKIQGQQVHFSVFLILSLINIKAFFHILLYLKNK